MPEPRMRLQATVLGARDPIELGAFYERLLGWTATERDPEWVSLVPPSGGTGLAFQPEPDQEPPVWPPVRGKQQMMMHLDFAVDDLEAAVGSAVAAGAILADHQPQDDVRVMIDPAGHLFCLFKG